MGDDVCIRLGMGDDRRELLGEKGRKCLRGKSVQHAFENRLSMSTPRFSITFTDCHSTSEDYYGPPGDNITVCSELKSR